MKNRRKNIPISTYVEILTISFGGGLFFIITFPFIKSSIQQFIEERKKPHQPQDNLEEKRLV